MGFADNFYYGQCKVVATSTTTADNGKTVVITNSGGRTWSGTMASKKCEFMLPPRDIYTIQLKSGNTVQYSTTIELGYGECRQIMVGMDPTTAIGIKAIVNAGLESQFFQTGDQIEFKENGVNVKFDVVHVGYRTAKHGHNIILQRHDCLTQTKQMNTSDTNVGGYNSSLMKTFLDSDYFNLLDSDLQAAISQYEWQGSVGNKSSSLQTEQHKIWLPVEYNVFGATTYAAQTEKTTGGAEQFAYYATAANRVKSANGASCDWWLSSPHVSGTTGFCVVNTSGAASYGNASTSYGVAPCFLIAAD